MLNANLLFSNISCSRDIQAFKYANQPSDDDIVTLKQILFKYDKKRYLSQFASEMFDTLQ